VASSYGYDSIYQVLSATQGAITTESYSYDPVGNRLSDLTTSGWSNNTSNELTSRPGVSYTFDNNGNELTKVVGSDTTSYAWDFENRLTSVRLPGTGGTVQFSYDPFGRRIKKVSSTGTSIFAYDQSNLVEETNGAGTVVARYQQGENIDEPLAMLRSSTTSYYETDGLGTVTSLSSGAGSLAQTYTFDSFGNTTASSGSLVNSLRFTARDFDAETNLQFSRARYYDAASGRFVSEDPIRFDGDGANFYGYVSNNPLNFVDPSGMFAELICEPIPTTRGGWKNAVFMLLSRAHHCFIHVKCRDYDVTIELYGPSQQDPKHGSPQKNPFNPNRRGIRRPITSPGGCDGKGDSKNCRLEDNLLNAFQKESGNIPLYNPYPGPNSNTFVRKIIDEAGGNVEFPNQAYGSDYVGPQ